MDNKTIFTKTTKGVGEARGKTKTLSRDFRNILNEIDGKSSIQELADKLGLPDTRLHDALTELANADYIREFASPTVTEEVDLDLDFTSSVKQQDPLTVLTIGAFQRESEQQAQRIADEKDQLADQPAPATPTMPDVNEKAPPTPMKQAKPDLSERERRKAAVAAIRREALEKYKHDVAERAKKEAEEKRRLDPIDPVKKAAEEKAQRKAAVAAIRREALEKYKHDVEERTRKAAEDKIRLEAEEKARKIAEEQARLDAEAKARRDAEQQAQQEAEARARHQAEEQARREAELEARREAEEEARLQAERERHDAEQRVRKELEEKARQEAKARAKKEAEERAQQKADEKAKREAQKQAERTAKETARLNAEAKLREEAEAKARLEAEARERVEAEIRARQEAEIKARLEAEAKVQQEAEEKARQEAETRARQEAAEKARLEAEAKARQEAETKARLEIETKSRQEAEAKALYEAAAKARQEAEAKAGQEAAARTRQAQAQAPGTETAAQTAKSAATEKHDVAERAEPAVLPVDGKPFRKPIKWRKPIAFTLSGLLVVGVILMHTMSFDSQLAQFEKLATAQFQQPVNIDKVYLSLLPQPHWRVEGITIGKEGQIKVDRIDANAGLDTLLGDTTIYRSLTLTSPVLTEEGLGWLIFGKSTQRGIQFGKITASNARLASPNIDLPVFNVNATIGGDGNWKKLTLDTEDRAIHVDLLPQGETVQVDINADAFAAPFGAAFTLEKFTASGIASRDALTLSKFSASILGGSIDGTAALKWNANWSLGGELAAHQIDTVKLAPQLFSSGSLEGRASYALQAQAANQLFSAPRLKGNLMIRDGTLLGVDFANELRGVNGNSKSAFSELGSSFLHERGKLQLRNMRLNAGLLSANGYADVDAKDNLSGRFAIELRTTSREARAEVALSGTLAKPSFNR